jgi:hypothetical protein
MLDNSKELPVAQVPGWACIAIGVGFIALLTAAIVVVRVLSGG